MPLARIDNYGQYGLIQDLRGWSIPFNAITFGNNIRTEGVNIESANGYMQYFNPVTRPTFVAGFEDPENSTFFIVYAGEDDAGVDKVHVYNGTVHTDITGAVLGDAVHNSSTALNGHFIYSNGRDVPRSWNGALSSNLTPLPGFDVDSCRVIREFNGFLLAMDIVESGIRYPGRLKWSSQANTTLPTSWDETDAATRAGEIDLGRKTTTLIESAVIRDTTFLYTAKEVLSMSFVGGPEVFRFRNAFNDFGILAPRCVIEYRNKNFVITNGDIIVHDGHTATSVINDRNRRTFFNRLEDDTYSRTFAVHYYKDDEIWVCFATQDETYPQHALVWNYADDTWGERDLPLCTTNIAEIYKTSGAQSTWTNTRTTWDDTVRTWGENLLNPSETLLLSTHCDTVEPDRIPATGFTPATGWNLGPGFSLSNGTLVCDGTQTESTEVILTAGLPEVTYKCIVDVASITAGELNVLAGTNSRGSITTAGMHTVYALAATTTQIGLVGDASLVATINSVSFQPIYAYLLDSGLTANGVARKSVVERTSIDLSQAPQRGSGEPINTITDILPVMEGDPVTIEVGTQQTPGGPVDWEPPKTFDPVTQYKIDLRSTGRYHAIRITSDTFFKLSRLEVMYEPTGER